MIYIFELGVTYYCLVLLLPLLIYFELYNSKIRISKNFLSNRKNFFYPNYAKKCSNILENTKITNLKC